MGKIIVLDLGRKKKLLLFFIAYFICNFCYSQLFVEDVRVKDSVLSKERGKDVYRIKGLAVKDTALVEMGVKDEKLYPILDSIMAYERSCKYYTDSLSYNIYINKKDNIIIQISSECDPGSILDGFNEGCFLYKGKEFAVWGNGWDILFFKKDNYIRFPYQIYYPQTGDVNSMWVYQYIDGSFVLQSYCRCNDKEATILFY